MNWLKNVLNNSRKQWRSSYETNNLTVEVCHPEHDVGYYSIHKEPDEHNITVKIKLSGKTICEGTSYS